MRIYKSYETLFKVIPVLSRRWRERLSSDSSSRIPAPLCTLISMLVDGAYGLFLRNPHHVKRNARHDLYHLRRSTLRRLGIGTGPATRPLPDAPAPIPFVATGGRERAVSERRAS